MQPHYGSLPEVLPGAPVAAERRSGNWRRAAAVAVATLACLAVVGVLAVRPQEPVALDAGCDEIECMINSPTKPPGAIKVPPRTLNPEEVEKLKEALLEEEGLESKVCLLLLHQGGMRARRLAAARQDMRRMAT
jgi:integrase